MTVNYPRFLGRLVCAIRARFGARPVHRYVRRQLTDAEGKRVVPVVNVNLCLRCGAIKPVKPRKRKGAE